MLLIPGVASRAECEAVVRSCATALDAGQRLVRLPSVAAAAAAAAEAADAPDSFEAFAGDPSADALLSQLPTEADAICDRILDRVLCAIDEQLRPVAVSQFGTQRLAELRAAGELEFAAREPAVNVYGEGGDFPPHQDHQALTVLVPLSGHGGGGTGFWTADATAAAKEAAAAAEAEAKEAAEDEADEVVDEEEEEEEDSFYDESWYDELEEEAAEVGWGRVSGAPPSTVLRAERGTALLWSGEVMHAGTPVEHGSRVVLVASFSGLRVWPDPWHRPLGAATYSVVRAIAE